MECIYQYISTFRIKSANSLFYIIGLFTVIYAFVTAYLTSYKVAQTSVEVTCY